jgi:hypothetical protein
VGAALVAQLADPDRGWDAIVVGEYERAFYGNQYASMAPLLEPCAGRCGVPRRRGAGDALLGVASAVRTDRVSQMMLARCGQADDPAPGAQGGRPGRLPRAGFLRRAGSAAEASVEGSPNGHSPAISRSNLQIPPGI